MCDILSLANLVELFRIFIKIIVITSNIESLLYRLCQRQCNIKEDPEEMLEFIQILEFRQKGIVGGEKWHQKVLEISFGTKELQWQ